MDPGIAPLPENHPSVETPPRGLDKSNARVRAMFAQIAPRYDLLNHLLSLNIDRSWRRKTVDRLRITSQKPILDMCTGTGDLALEIRRRSDPAIEVIGSDFCHPMLERARRKGESLGSENLFFVEADSQALPFSADTFQVVTVAFGLRNVADTDRGLREMQRVCRPGGQIAILEFSQPSIPGLSAAYRFYFSQVLPRVGQWMAENDNAAYHYLPASVSQFPSGRALAERMEAVGIRDVRFHPMTGGIATLYEGFK